MKIQRKISSLIRRNVSFFAITYDWDQKILKIINTFDEYLDSIRYLNEIGMCKRCQTKPNHQIVFGEHSFEVCLVSYGDIRHNRAVYGQNPISSEFNICMFDYVYLFITKIEDKKMDHFQANAVSKPRKKIQGKNKSNKAIVAQL